MSDTTPPVPQPEQPASGVPAAAPVPPAAPAAPQAPYGQPGYGQPTYGQPAYGQQQPYAQPAAYGQPYAVRRTNALAIVALILGFVVPLGGIICGHIALGQIKRTGEDGRGLALAGTVLGYVFTGIAVLFIIFYIIVVVIAVGAAGVATYGSSTY